MKDFDDIFKNVLKGFCFPHVRFKTEKGTRPHSNLYNLKSIVPSTLLPNLVQFSVHSWLGVVWTNSLVAQKLNHSLGERVVILLYLQC